ncbi:MAG: Spy/CpxP family protein refolding chaperone [Methylobacteriaceae bacterium]|nr:Spy/CpxP family protein refolding chaperone [Methylobacteriaceae bacterium]MBV9392865.1 Spy/CpxP family protein refolding chaperone [Methylobacteriaceae bacterium]
MKSPLLIVVLLTGGLGMGALAASAIAQTPSAPPAPSNPPTPSQAQAPEHASPAFDMPGERMFERMSRFSPEDRAAFFDARLAAIHAGLRLTPEQEKLWPAVEGAARDAMKSMMDERQKLRAAGPATNPIDRMQRRAERLTLRGQSMQKIADAARPFYASLSDEQKHRLSVLMHAGHGWRERMGMRMHEQGWGRGGEHGDRGWRQGRMRPDEDRDFDRGGGNGDRGWRQGRMPPDEDRDFDYGGDRGGPGWRQDRMGGRDDEPDFGRGGRGWDRY